MVKLYRFDGIDASLSLVPLAARRALDALGVKLSLDGFLSLPLEARRQLVIAGSKERVDLGAARAGISGARPAAAPHPTPEEPSADQVPSDVLAAFGPHRPIPEKVWQGLTPLDRYALSKVARKPRPERLDGAHREIVGGASVSTHVRPEGGVHMVSISGKSATQRRAVAECWVTMSPESLARMNAQDSPKGDVLSTARLAGIMATKRTSDLIPLCHPLALQHAEIDFESYPSQGRVRVTCSVEVEAKTGVEMEAMVGANVAALTIYDMLKSLEREMTIGPCRLLHKSGGRSGTFQANDDPEAANLPTTSHHEEEG